MTQEKLSPEEYSFFSRVFETSKENLSHQTNPVNINLETYFQALFQIEPIPTIFKKQNQVQYQKMLDIMH